MPVMKMARLKLKIAKTSIAAAQHFMSLSAAAALIFDGVSVRVERRLRGVEEADQTRPSQFVFSRVPSAFLARAESHEATSSCELVQSDRLYVYTVGTAPPPAPWR